MTRELMITPARVAEAAFRAPDHIAPGAIPESTVIAAQRKFVRPVVGGALYDRLAAGDYPELLDEYIRPPLALYVKMLMLPSLAVQTGMAGVVEVTSKNLVKASDARLAGAVARLRSDAGTLMRRAAEHIEASGAYPEYDAGDNVLNRCSTAGGIVLPL